MLVISRRAGESVLIGEDIEIRVLETGSRRIKLGIQAPETIAVLREEVHATREQNRAASQGMPLDLVAPLLSGLPGSCAPPKKRSSSRHPRR